MYDFIASLLRLNHFNLVYLFFRHFRIHVFPLELKLVNNSIIEVQQGLRMAHITAKNLGSKSNGQRALTFFNITRGPKGGLIYMNDAPASVFGQVSLSRVKLISKNCNYNCNRWVNFRDGASRFFQLLKKEWKFMKNLFFQYSYIIAIFCWNS